MTGTSSPAAEVGKSMVSIWWKHRRVSDSTSNEEGNPSGDVKFERRRVAVGGGSPQAETAGWWSRRQRLKKFEGKSSIILEQRYRSDKTYPSVSTKMTWQNFERSLVVKRTEPQFLIEEVFYRSPIFSGSRRCRLVHKTSEAETAPGQGIRPPVGLANKATLLSEKGNQSKLKRIDSLYFSEQQFFGEKATRWI